MNEYLLKMSFVSGASSVALIAIGTSRVWCPDYDGIFDKRLIAILLQAVLLVLSARFQSLSQAGSIAALAAWHPLTRRISAWWPNVAKTYLSLPTWVYTGPLGKGCSKVVEVLLACLLWQAVRGEIPLMLLPKDRALSVGQAAAYTGVLLAFSIVVNIVLSLWSRTTGSKGNHAGLQEYSNRRSSSDMSTIRNHVELMSLAVINAACEECTSRGIWRHAFMITANMSWAQANVAQAIIFGVWHFYGVPSGWIGVGLTFLYGLLMGWMSDWFGGGLLLPILTHTVADYYIFAVIMRQKLDSKPL
jgi:Type II CAAX prenyl endopeptidase Rce1-like